MAIDIVRLWKRAAWGSLSIAFALALHAQDSGTEPALDGQDPSSDSQTPATATPFEPRFRLHLYSDLDSWHQDNPGGPNRFSVDEIDLFGTYALTPSLTALTEMVVDTSGSTSQAEVPINVERLLLQYRVNDFLKIEAGQLRTSIGYYSTAYLRGAWFQTAITRPRMFAFEEDGGVLPLHLVGVSANGAIPSGPLGLHYVVETGNSRIWGTDPASVPVQIAIGHDAFNVALAARPPAIPGLEAGFSDYHDLSLLSGLTVHRSMVSAHIVYTANRFEFLNEGVYAAIRYDPANATASMSGFYSQLGYRVGRNWGPFVRVEKLAVQASPFFGSMAGIAPWRSIYSTGIRYDWNDHVALKLQLGHEADWGSPHYYQAAVQVAFAF